MRLISLRVAICVMFANYELEKGVEKAFLGGCTEIQETVRVKRSSRRFSILI